MLGDRFMTSQEGSTSSAHKKRAENPPSASISGEWLSSGTCRCVPKKIVWEKKGRDLLSSSFFIHRHESWKSLTHVEGECVEWWWQHVCRPACCGIGPVGLHMSASAGLDAIFCDEPILPVTADIAHWTRWICQVSDQDLNSFSSSLRIICCVI